MADLTKKAIAEGLKELCHHKDFNKISVRDITEQCGLNRQTFYYHFQDKYELLDWIYYQEGFVYLASDVTFDNWHEHMEKLLEMMKKNGKEEYRTADEVRKDLEILKTLQQKGAHPQVILDALKEKLKNKTIEIDERLLNQVKCEN